MNRNHYFQLKMLQLLGLEQPCRDCYVANPCTCTEYEHSVAICPSGLLVQVFCPIVGFLIGLIGHAIKDAMSGGLWWTRIISWFVWTLCYFFRNKSVNSKGEVTKKELIVFNVVQIVSNLVIWGLIAPVGDVRSTRKVPIKSSYKVLLPVHLML